MSRFFIQMLLSIAVAVSAAVGFSPDAQGKVKKSLREAKSFVHEATQSIFNTASTLNPEAEISADVSAETSLESKLDAAGDLELDKSSKKSSEVGVGTSLSTGTGTAAQIDSNNADLDLKKKIESDVTLESNMLR
jgi:hypothetical protein